MYKKRNNVAREGIHERKVDPISVDSGVLGNYLSSRFNRRPVFRIGSNDAVYRIYIVVRPSNCLNYPSISLSFFLPAPHSLSVCWPLFEAGYILLIVGPPSPLMYVQLSTSTWSSTVGKLGTRRRRRRRLGSRSRKTFIISCERETVRLLLRAGILKKDDLERGSAMICAGRQAEKRARAEQRGNAARIVCVRVYAREHKRRRGRG